MRIEVEARSSELEQDQNAYIQEDKVISIYICFVEHILGSRRLGNYCQQMMMA